MFDKKQWARDNVAACRKARRKHWQKLHDWLRAVKSQPCLDCGHSFPPECMDFHHVRGRKLFSIGANVSKGRRALEREIKKCDLICSNCHRIRTRKRSK